MPRNISFALTTAQFKARTKDVTRRVGWHFLKVGDVLCGVEKGRGLKRGEKVERLGYIRVIDVSFEPLDRMERQRAYGRDEVRREGFPELTPAAFVTRFTASHKCTRGELVTRIVFEHIDPPEGAL